LNDTAKDHAAIISNLNATATKHAKNLVDQDLKHFENDKKVSSLTEQQIDHESQLVAHDGKLGSIGKIIDD
jgi:hypothetical protein